MCIFGLMGLILNDPLVEFSWLLYEIEIRVHVGKLGMIISNHAYD